jgi:CBS domain-containing protein
MFPMPAIPDPEPSALIAYVALGALLGVAAVGVTRLVYPVEDAFGKLPVHWMWGPAIGGLAVGVVGFVEPATLGVGYDNITRMLNGEVVGIAVLALAALKLVSWTIALGSGTSGGTLAPLLTVGGGLGAAAGAGLALALPQAGVDPRVAALVGMAAMFAGASRALLASVVFAFETTLQVHGLLPLLAGCTAAYLVSCLLMQNTIMTEKIVRRGVRVPVEYAADFMDRIFVGDAASAPVLTLAAGDSVASVRRWFARSGVRLQHQGFPVVDDGDRLVGVVTLRNLLDPSVDGERLVRDLVARTPVVTYPDCTLREAADVMAHEGIGRLPVVARDAPLAVLGMLTRSDLLAAHRRRLAEARIARRSIRLGRRTRTA